MIYDPLKKEQMMTDKEVGALWLWIKGTAERVENPDIYSKQHIQDVSALIRKLVEERAKRTAAGTVTKEVLRDFGIGPEMWE